MSEIHNSNGSINSHTTEVTKNIFVPDYIDTIFQRLAAQDVEQFYKSYHFWSLQQRMKTLQVKIDAIQQALTDNGTLMQQVQPSAIALSSLAQLQASGVNDLDLLDRMLARGDTWLDHTMQLLAQCEELDVIRSNYTQWCEHALEGAYDWLSSIEAAQDNTDAFSPLENRDKIAESTPSAAEAQPELQTPTEEQLLVKLMSDEELNEKIPVLNQLPDAIDQTSIQPSLPFKKITQPLEQTEHEINASSLPIRKITQPLTLPEHQTLEASLPTRKITQPLEQTEHEINASSLSMRKITQPLELIDTSTEAETPTTSASDAFKQSTLASPNEPAQEHSIGTPSESDDEQTEEAQPSATPSAETKDIILLSEEEMVDTAEVPALAKKAPVATKVGTTKEVVLSAAVFAQTSRESTELIASPQENKMPQAQRVPQRGLWHWLRRLFAAILRR